MKDILFQYSFEITNTIGKDFVNMYYYRGFQYSFEIIGFIDYSVCRDALMLFQYYSFEIIAPTQWSNPVFAVGYVVSILFF